MDNIWDGKARADAYFPEDLRQMRPLEQRFRQFYERTGFCTRTAPMTSEEFTDLLKEAAADQDLDLGDPDDYGMLLQEEAYFQSRMDLSATENVRYMPAVIHQHQFFEVACVLSGEVMNFAGEETMLLHQGDILIMPPGSSHAVCSYAEDGILVNILMRSSTFEQHFLGLLPDDDMLRGFFAQALYKAPDTPYLLFHTGKDPLIDEDIRQLIHELGRNNRYKNTMLTSLLSLFFVHLMRAHEKDVIIPTMGASVRNENTIFIIEYMQKNYSTITLHHLAEFFHYSERQMQRIIHAATGLSFGENIQRLRIQHAKVMLREKDHTVQEIADILGYYDASSFRHAFREAVGMTPQAYRKAQQQPENN